MTQSLDDMSDTVAARDSVGPAVSSTSTSAIRGVSACGVIDCMRDWRGCCSHIIRIRTHVMVASATAPERAVSYDLACCRESARGTLNCSDHAHIL